MYGYELGKAWRKRWVLRWRLKEFGNIANSCKCCLEANSRQQKQHSEMSVHQQISGWSVEFSSISQMMIGANDLVGKYEGQKTNKVAKYHQNAWRQKWQVWIGFKTPRVAGEAQWARVLCDHVFFSWGLARQHSFGYANSKRLSWSEVIELQKLIRDREWRTTDVTSAFRYKSVIKTNTKIFDRILKYDVKMQNPNRITIDLSSPQSCHYLA